MSGLTTTDRLKELLPQLFSEQKAEGDYYLRFQLTEQISALIELKYVQESLTIQGDRITPIPNLPEYVVGLMSSRNQVFLAMDLAHLIGLPPETVNLRQYQTIIVRDRAITDNSQNDQVNLFGLTVKRIEGIARILPQDFSTVVEELPISLRSFVSSALINKSNDSEFESDRVIDLSESIKASFLLDLPKLITTKTNSNS